MTVLSTTPKMTDRAGDGYEQFAYSIHQNFESMIQAYGPHLFTTDATGLFETFLEALPPDGRQHYNCRCCERFIKTYGGLVALTEGGSMAPAMWTKAVPAFFQASATAMRNLIKSAKVTGVFLSSQSVWGTPVTGEWRHMHVIPPVGMVHSNRLANAGQKMAEKVQDFDILQRSLLDFPLPVAEQAVTLLKSESLYRSDRVLGVAEWFQKLHQTLAATKNAKAKINHIWRAVATAPASFCHIRSSMIGTLLEDLKDGLSIDAVRSRFAEKMNPSNYQRAQVAPTAGGVAQAEQVVKKLGLENSLRRRYMTIEDIPSFVWRRREVAPKAQPGGVFAGVATKQKDKAQPTMTLPSSTMTWAKFAHTILPNATKIEVKADNPNRFAALVTAADPTAPNILQWDNGASWYYHGGVDAEMRQRVERAGGQHEGNEIRFTGMWNTRSDLDIHVEAPHDGHIYHARKRGQYGWLDVDMNVNGETLEPVENIRWRTAMPGHYKFYIHNFNDRNQGYNPYKVEIEILGQVHTFEGVLGTTNSQHTLAVFAYQRGVVPTLSGMATVTNGTSWNLETNQFHEVTGIVKSPNLWGDKPAAHAGDHTFFLIDGCKDTAEGKGRGFFNEMLKPELREIRRTLEAYTAGTPVEGAESASACGLGYSKDGEWNVTLRVTTNNSVAEYKLDRYD